MSLSVIIPARNEEACIADAVDSALHGEPFEVIVVDGASEDRTASIARARGAAVLTSPPGRGIQLHRGAEAATGDQLVFLHADCRLPEGYAGHVREVLSRPGVSAGAFRLRIDAPSRSLRVIERLVSLRSRLGSPYGDQAIFTGTDVYRRAGGFPPIPAMEDFEFVRRMRKLGRVVIAPASILASGRGWQGRGVIATTALNQVCVLAWLLGVSPARIATWRRWRSRSGARPGPVRA